MSRKEKKDFNQSILISLIPHEKTIKKINTRHEFEHIPNIHLFSDRKIYA